MKFKKAKTSFQSLDNPDDWDWISSAFAGNYYTEEKAPCQNCSVLFENLRGDPDPWRTPETAGGSRTFLVNCVEYCPVNELLTGDMTASSTDKLWVDAHMDSFWNQCSVLFYHFTNIIDKCVAAYDSKEPK